MSDSPIAPAKRGALPFVQPILFAVIGGLIVWGIIAGWQTWNEVSAASKAPAALPMTYGLGNGEHKRLNPQFTSKDGLIAATPTDPSKLIDPAELKIVYVESDEEAAAKISWDDLAKQISTATGKPVSAHPFDSDRSPVDVIHDGNYQILVVHAAETPYLVNNLGFVPFAVVGDEHGPDGHRLNIVVNVTSPMQNIQDIRGHVLECTQLQSITGYRAALAYLSQSCGLRAGEDFQVIYSGTPSKSVRDIVGGSEAAAAVSNDKLLSMTKKGEISPKSYRVLYESEPIPRFAVGTMYNLKPEIAEAVKKAVLSYVGDSVQPGVKGRVIRFIPVDYAKDFALVRAIDDAFESRVLTGISKATTKPAK